MCHGQILEDDFLFPCLAGVGTSKTRSHQPTMPCLSNHLSTHLSISHRRGLIRPRVSPQNNVNVNPLSLCQLNNNNNNNNNSNSNNNNNNKQK